jgi:hypothetical protein
MKYITSVLKQDIVKHTENVEQHRMGEGWGSAVEEGYIDLSTIHLQVKYQGKNPTASNIHLNNEGQECKTGHTNRRALIRGEG